MPLKFRIIITDPLPVLERRLKSAVADKINLAGNLVVNRLKPKIAEIVKNAVLSSPEVQSLHGGILQAELGATTSQIDDVINYIIRRLTDTISIDFKALSPFASNIMKGELRLRVFPKILVNDIIAFSASSIKTRKGVELPWVQWLLKLGDKIIIRNYSVDYSNRRGSRTGLARMKKTNGYSWRVPPQFSGVESDNFITRALDDVADLMMYHLKLEFTRAI